MTKTKHRLLQLCSSGLCALISVSTFSATPAPAEDNQRTLKALMADASSDISTLIPLAYDDEAFRIEKNQQQIQEYLNNLEAIFTQKAERLGNQSDTAWISLKVLQGHLSETANLYQAGYFAMSQYLLTSTPAICATCHLQDSAHSTIKSQLTHNQFANDYSFAEYLFTIRQYDEAEAFYKSHLQSPEVHSSRFRFLKPLERLMTIELGIRRSAANTIQMLEFYDNASTQIEIKQVINEWLDGVKAITAAGAKNQAELETLFKGWFSTSPGTSHEFILDEARRPQAIWLRAKLFESLPRANSRADTASVLYMLAIIDRVLGQVEPYSFANLYLKQCVLSYPETPSAGRCLEEYKNHLSFYYGGSAGEAVPEELVDEYNIMKKALQSAH